MNQIEEFIHILRLEDETKIDNLKTIYSYILLKDKDRFYSFNEKIIELTKEPNILLVLRGLYLLWIKEFKIDFEKAIASIEAAKFYYGK